METYLGIDLGGTKLLIGEIDRQGNILRYKKYASGYLNQREAADLIRRSLDDYIVTVGWSGPGPVAMGAGLPGRVDNEEGNWCEIDPGRVQPVALARELSEAYGIPCRLDNDVKSATRAELAWGAGRFSKNFIFINVGTGIAVGTVSGGRLVRGSHFNAGEAGHMRVGVNLGVSCVCGRSDCVEVIASGSGFDRCARLLSGRCETKLQIPSVEEGRVSVARVYELCREGDELCKVLVDNAAEALANLIMNLVRVSDPDTVVLGGGVVADGFMYRNILGRLQQHTMRFVTNGVVITTLNPEFSGLLGAGAVAMNI